MPAPELSVDQARFAAVMKALKSETDGKELRKELNATLKGIAEPAVGRAKAAAMALPSSPGPRMEGGGLRQAIASQIKPEIRASGRDTGVRIRVKNKNMPRGFKWAAKRFNDTKSWRHPLFGNRDVWIEQSSGDPNWFDREVMQDKEAYEAQIMDAIEAMADRIARRAGN